jgi:hypothetical protein
MTVRRMLVTSGVAAAVALALGGISLASAGSTESAIQHQLVLKAVQTKSTFVSVSHTQSGGPGDEFIFHSKLLDRHGQRVGSIDAVCTLVFNNQAQCAATATLPGGTLAASALSPMNGLTTKVAITGGTGKYLHASGQVISVSKGPNSNISTDTFNFTT